MKKDFKVDIIIDTGEGTKEETLEIDLREYKFYELEQIAEEGVEFPGILRHIDGSLDNINSKQEEALMQGAEEYRDSFYKFDIEAIAYLEYPDREEFFRFPVWVEGSDDAKAFEVGEDLADSEARQQFSGDILETRVFRATEY